MPAIINPKLTDAGKAAAVNANATGLQLAITHIALGTGQYSSATSGAGMTSMVGRKEQVKIGAGIVTGAGGFRVNVLFDSWAGTPNPYNATELGFYAGDPTAGGVLFAVYSHPSDIIVQRNSLKFTASFNIQITDVPSGSITVLVDPDADESLALIALHEGAADPHPGYVKKSGDTSIGPQLGVTAPQHDDSLKFTTSAFVKRVGKSYPSNGGMGIAGDTTLTAAAMGRWGDITANGAVVALPLTDDCPIGASVELRVSALSGLLITQGTDVLVVPPQGSVTRFQLTQGETVTVTRNEAGKWHVLGTSSRLPAGMISYFAGAAAPTGWLKLNGAILTRAAYPALWQYAQSTGVVSDADWASGYTGRFSSGVAGNDFRLPDARGTFLRALDDARGLDAGRAWGTYQDHANRSHNHSFNDPGHTHAVYDPGHGHAGATDGQGNHAHGITDPGHKHTSGRAGPDLMINGPYTAGIAVGAGSGSGGTWEAWAIQNGATGISIQPGGVHAHNVSINASASNISLYGASTGITIQADGSEARPRNLAFAMCIKF